MASTNAVLLVPVTSVLMAPAQAPKSADEATVAVENIQEAGVSSGIDLPKFFKAGPFELRPYFSGSMLYDDNIRISSANTLNDVVWTLSPGILIGAGQYQDAGGTYLTLNYRPDIVLYTENSDFNSVDNWVNFNAQKRWEKLTLGLGQAFQSGAGGYTEAMNRVDRSIYVTTARASYQYSEKTSFELNGLQNISDYDQDANNLTSYNQWEGQLWAKYQAAEKANAGLGCTFGWRDVRGAENQTYQQALLRGGYLLTDKTRFTVSVGMQFLQYQEGGSDDPQFIFDIAGIYRPWARTTLTLSAYRRDNVSVVQQGENYTTTGFRATVRQQMWEKVFVTLTGGYEESSYYGPPNVTGTGRHDNYWYVGPAIDYQFTDRWFIGAFYRYRQNDSSGQANPANNARNTFDNNQVGIRTLLRY